MLNNVKAFPFNFLLELSLRHEQENVIDINITDGFRTGWIDHRADTPDQNGFRYSGGAI